MRSLMACLAATILLTSSLLAKESPVFSESFEGPGKAVSGGSVSGELAAVRLTENSSWTQSTLRYSKQTKGAYKGKGFQRIELVTGERHELMAYHIPAAPKRYFLLRIALRSREKVPIGLSLSNTKTPKWGDPYLVRWSTTVETTDKWEAHEFLLPDHPTEDSLRLGLCLRAKGTVDIDEYELVTLDERSAKRLLAKESKKWLDSKGNVKNGTDPTPPPAPWSSVYAYTKENRKAMTAADILGPDGLVYPDWRRAGVPGGVPKIRSKYQAEKFGAKPDDDQDDSAAIQQALDKAAEKGGAVELDAGTYHLDSPLLIRGDGVVLRGAGMDKTKLIFRYMPKAEEVRIIYPAGDTLTRADKVEAHAYPEGLQSIEVYLGKTLLGKSGPAPDGQGGFSFGKGMPELTYIVKPFPTGKQTLRAVATWSNGKQSEAKKNIQIDLKASIPEGQIRFTGSPAAITITGDAWTNRGRRWSLKGDMKRGDTEVEFVGTPQLQKGDILLISVPSHATFIERIQSARKEIPRRGRFVVEKVKGNTVKVDRPARIDYPADQGAQGETVYPIREAGVEDLTLVQPQKLWTDGIVLRYAYSCWVRRVRVDKAGRNPITIGNAMNCEVRESECNDAWYLAGGGTGYVAFTDSSDCLIENITTRRLRHAPNPQWGSQGCVVRNSTFEQSDAQYHMGWAVENLLENITVDAKTGSGSYGYGLYAQKPEVGIHGPGGGPRNVVYNCDLLGPRGAVFLGGSNQGWMFMYNRLASLGDSGVTLRHNSLDLIFQGNHIILNSPIAPAFLFEASDISGVKLIDNTIAGGSGLLFQGQGKPAVWTGNRFKLKKTELDRPAPAVPSIFEWQRKYGR